MKDYDYKLNFTALDRIRAKVPWPRAFCRVVGRPFCLLLVAESILAMYMGYYEFNDTPMTVLKILLMYFVMRMAVPVYQIVETPGEMQFFKEGMLICIKKVFWGAKTPHEVISMVQYKEIRKIAYLEQIGEAYLQAYFEPYAIGEDFKAVPKSDKHKKHKDSIIFKMTKEEFKEMQSRIKSYQ